jgi:hypothetical protein
MFDIRKGMHRRKNSLCFACDGRPKFFLEFSFTGVNDAPSDLVRFRRFGCSFVIFSLIEDSQDWWLAREFLGTIIDIASNL